MSVATARLPRHRQFRQPDMTQIRQHRTMGQARILVGQARILATGREASRERTANADRRKSDNE